MEFLAAKGANPPCEGQRDLRQADAKRSAWEKEIDQLVYPNQQLSMQASVTIQKRPLPRALLISLLYFFLLFSFTVLAGLAFGFALAFTTFLATTFFAAAFLTGYFNATCAAASLAIGTRNGEHET